MSLLNDKTRAFLCHTPEMIDNNDWIVSSKENGRLAAYQKREDAEVFIDGYNRNLAELASDFDRRTLIDIADDRVLDAEQADRLRDLALIVKRKARGIGWCFPPFFEDAYEHLKAEIDRLEKGKGNC